MSEAPKLLQDLTLSVSASRLAYFLALLELRGKKKEVDKEAGSDHQGDDQSVYFLNVVDKLRTEYDAHFPGANMDSDILFFGAARALFPTTRFGMAYSAHKSLEKLKIEGLAPEIQRYKGLLSVDKGKVANALKKAMELSPAELTELFEQMKKGELAPQQS